MIKVLDKTFAILEDLAVASPQALRIVELAERHGINPATCSRILRELVDAGYAVQISRQDGYAAGPRAWTFARQISYHERMIRFAEPIIRKCAESLRASVLLVELHNCERYILLHHNYCTKLDIRLTELSNRDVFETATGLMLAANADAERLDKLFAAYPAAAESPLFPPGADLREELRKIRLERECSYAKGNQGIAAFPVFRNRKVVASLGGSIAVEDFIGTGRKRMIEALRQAASNLSKTISIVNTAG